MLSAFNNEPVANRRYTWEYNRYTRGVDPMVLAYKPSHVLRLKEIADRIRTVSRRSELKSRTILMDEQSNPWKRLHLQDMAIQHRGGKHPRR